MTDATPPSIPPSPPSPGRRTVSSRSVSGAIEAQSPRSDPPTSVEGPEGLTPAETAASPLATVVEATTGWLKKVSRVTTTRASSAYSSGNRPDLEDMTMDPATATQDSAVSENTRVGWPTEVPTAGADEALTSRPAGGPRRVRLVMSRIDPWSMMKLAFLLSFGVGIIAVVATSVVWLTLDGMHVFATTEDLITQVAGASSANDAMAYFSFSKVVAATMLVAVVDVFLITALSTIGAFLYNIVAALVGGLHMTMTDE